MGAYRIDAGSAYHTSQDGGNDDRIVGITEHRDDVWHQVDGYRQVAQQ
jgi:hypothetical protein